jgi:hypothetical protein
MDAVCCVALIPIPWKHTAFCTYTGGGSRFETMPSKGQKCNLIPSYKGGKEIKVRKEKKREVLGGTNGLLSLIRHWPH